METGRHLALPAERCRNRRDDGLGLVELIVADIDDGERALGGEQTERAQRREMFGRDIGAPQTRRRLAGSCRRRRALQPRRRATCRPWRRGVASRGCSTLWSRRPKRARAQASRDPRPGRCRPRRSRPRRRATPGRSHRLRECRRGTCCQDLPARRAGDETGLIGELDRRSDDLAALRHLGERDAGGGRTPARYRPTSRSSRKGATRRRRCRP